MNTLICDIGNVVISWRPEALFPEIAEDQAALDHWLDEIGFNTWYNASSGDRQSGLAELPFALHARVKAYLGAYRIAVKDPMPGTADVLKKLKDRDIRLLALSNAPPEAGDLVADCHQSVMAMFEDVFVSGREGLRKPDPQAYLTLLTRNGLAPEHAGFVDDSPAYVAVAQELGLKGHVFKDADALERWLSDEGML